MFLERFIMLFWWLLVYRCYFKYLCEVYSNWKSFKIWLLNSPLGFAWGTIHLPGRSRIKFQLSECLRLSHWSFLNLRFIFCKIQKVSFFWPTIIIAVMLPTSQVFREWNLTLCVTCAGIMYSTHYFYILISSDYKYSWCKILSEKIMNIFLKV